MENIDFERIEEFMTAIGGNTQPCPMVTALENGDLNQVMRLVNEEGHDPFRAPNNIFDLGRNTAFHEASKRRDVDLLLAMAADVGSNWEKSFLICSGGLTNTPQKGRDYIATASHSGSGNFFTKPETASVEGLEVMVKYGYKLKERDFEYCLVPLAMQDPINNLRLLKFGLACVKCDKIKLDICLGMAIGGAHESFLNESHPTSLDVARILLQAGANPNGYCFQGETPYDFVPAIFQAIRNEDPDMTRLLLSYGADVSAEAQFSRWIDDERLDIETISAQQKADELNMAELLLNPEVVPANPESYINEIRKEFIVPVKHIFRDFSAILVVAAMRSTGQVPPVGLISQLIMDYYPLGFSLWRIE